MTVAVAIDAAERSGSVWDNVAAAVTLLVALGAIILICVLKGKYKMALIGLGSIGLSYLLGHFVWTLPIIALVGAIRLAKPDSEWARRFYDERQLAESRTRFNHAPEAAGLRE